MSDEQIKEGLLSIDEGHVFVKTLLALFDNEIRDEQLMATAPDLTDGARHFNAGRLARAMDTRNSILGLMRDARAEREAAEKKRRKET